MKAAGKLPLTSSILPTSTGMSKLPTKQNVFTTPEAVPIRSHGEEVDRHHERGDHPTQHQPRQERGGGGSHEPPPRHEEGEGQARHHAHGLAEEIDALAPPIQSEMKPASGQDTTVPAVTRPVTRPARPGANPSCR
jgi:hypothetical protein